MKNRRSLTPSTGLSVDAVHATRRGGARHDLTAKVTLTPRSGAALEGWALNVSRGGLRVILEDRVELGAEFEIAVAAAGPNEPTTMTGRVVWVQEEPDGVVAGLEFKIDGGEPAPTDGV